MRETVTRVTCDICGRREHADSDWTLPPGWYRVTVVRYGKMPDPEHEAHVCERHGDVIRALIGSD